MARNPVQNQKRPVKSIVSPRIDPGAVEFYAGTFDNKNAGATYALEAFPVLYKATIRGLVGKFSHGELMLMLDVQNGVWLTPGIAGQHVLADCLDGMSLNAVHEKWGVDRTSFTTRLRNLHIFEMACLEVWARKFWNEDTDADTYVASLAVPENHA